MKKLLQKHPVLMLAVILSSGIHVVIYVLLLLSEPKTTEVVVTAPALEPRPTSHDTLVMHDGYVMHRSDFPPSSQKSWDWPLSEDHPALRPQQLEDKYWDGPGYFPGDTEDAPLPAPPSR